jgi:hypothetical protein
MARILQTDASLWKEEKTLSFCPTPSVWDSVWTGRLADGSLPTFVLLDTYSEEYSACTLVLCREGQGKGIHLPTLHMLFPHLDPWDGTTAHAVLLLATLLRYRRVYDPSSQLGKTHLHITQEPPRPLILITEYHKESFEKNTKNPQINRIITKKAKTFADIFAVIATLPKSYVVFTRKGIVLDDMRDVWSIPMKKTLLSLLSYEVPSSGNLEDASLPPISDVQDTWIIRSEDVPQGYFSFPIEQTKSESVFAYRMLQERFLVVNPARSLKTWRLLPSIPTPPVSSPVYHFIHPTGINEMNPLLTGSRKMSLPKMVEGTDAVRWVHMLSKKGIAESLGESTYTYTKQEGFAIKDCFQTMSGLAFDSTTMYIGSGKGAQEAWSNESLYALLPTQVYESGTIVHFPEEYMPRELCVLHVISRLLMHNEGVYLCPESCRSLFATFGLKGIPPLPDTHFVYKKAFCYPVDGVSPEMIQALRKSIEWIPEPVPFDGRLSIVCVHCYIEELRGAWDVRRLDDTMSVESIIANLRGAWGIILGPSAVSSWNWILPLGARVFELSSMDTEAHDISTIAGLRHIFTTEARLTECIADTP